MSSAFNGLVPVRVLSAPTPPHGRFHRIRGRHGFTLIELLIVVGIIAVLLSLLLPSLSRAREQARQIQCLNNLRQIGVGVRLYLQTSRDYPPAAAVNGLEMKEDWIYWQADRRPDPTVATGMIPKAMGGHMAASIFICPSDELAAHPENQQYPFSYSANCQVFPPLKLPGFSYDRISSPANCIIIIDESSLTVDDGCWWADHYSSALESGSNVLSNRHDRRDEDPKNLSAGRGNVLYADFHAAFIPRAECMQPANWLAYLGQLPY